MNTHSALANLTPEATIEEIIAADRKAGDLLASIGLEPASHKSETLRSVCQQLKWSEVEVLTWVKKNRIVRNGNSQEQKQKKSEKLDYGANINQWCKYVEDQYHPQLLSLLGEVTHDFPRIHKIHGNQYTWLKHLQWPLEKFDDKLQYYTYFESKKFFPVVKSLTDRKQDTLDGTIQKIQRGMEIMMEDQKALLKLMNTIEQKGNKLQNPKGACSTLRILNYNLKKLFSTLREEFTIEQQNITPRIKERLNTS
ncbi:hypothetical protein NC796_06085 [Aliifodinibius sp. S!AR15-10]|uniref:hypothetical protein n=1 Tax=Aliifodinibius sp. S!AR15-10 TaxID=2950437 RepID=UPI00286378E5|nr:hypothetical protein [Aliifodinibius sp. S!AR15-10]MDR8390695.1 hypothetical protein [Aliifodinibius sp. S!AR15-10]